MLFIPKLEIKEKIQWLLLLSALLIYAPVSAEHELNPVTLDLPMPEDLEIRPHDELQIVNDLVAITEKNLATQKEFQALLKENRLKQGHFMRLKDSTPLAPDMIRLSKALLRKIHEHHLTGLFGDDFIHELTLFSQLRKPS